MEIILKYFDDFTSTQLQQFAALKELYEDWNSKINVISRKDIDGLYEKHVLHSLSIAALFDFPDNINIIDIGTGGGFPGIPLAIYFPAVQFHLVDSIGKKLKVIEAIVSSIGLANVTTQHIRAEEIRDRKFDFAVSRAVAPLNELWMWARPLVLKSGYKMKNSEEDIKSGLICLKGGDLAAEISASGCRPKQVEIFEIFPEEYFKQKFLLHVAK
jgi:16S rRNA (guanine527-N7)-methyltransferase